jgi:ketosteroid isomerase-like protein
MPGERPLPPTPIQGETNRVADDILELQRAFDDAELHADTGRLAALLADDFLSIGERGFQLDKGQWIGRHREFRYLAIETTEVDVRRYDRAAIVRCVQRSRASWRGEPMTLAVRLSQVWIQQPDGWRLAGIQFSTLDPG